MCKATNGRVGSGRDFAFASTFTCAPLTFAFCPDIQSAAASVAVAECFFNSGRWFVTNMTTGILPVRTGHCTA